VSAAVSITSWRKNSLYFGSAIKCSNSHLEMVAVHFVSCGARDPNPYSRVLAVLQIPWLCKFISAILVVCTPVKAEVQLQIFNKLLTKYFFYSPAREASKAYLRLRKKRDRSLLMHFYRTVSHA